MKKILCALLLGAAAAPAARAQTTPAADAPAKPAPPAAAVDDLYPQGNASHNTGFGLKGGYALSQIYGNGTGALPGAQSHQSFLVGAYGQYGFNAFASVQVELLYSRKGYRTTLGNASAYNTRLDYLDLPILFVGNLTPNLSFHLGPQVSLLENVAHDGTNAALSGRYNRLAVGGVGGLEGRVGNVRLGARYDLSLSKLYHENANEQFNTSGVYLSNNNIYSRTAEVYLSYGLSR
ncbi:outer membrane beta-barrel protein [Hymenobacter caeli]|uniref:Outer membrane protein beta-barrel domain-containing protein n=1 Tax=Hymenobacter caeli TaxID=2735894 RepID=A0ABX2FLQ7_9BACT|nr:outer membrane beta-barrel protein [Hymenobacter caeli]NRT18061.1 hypothetical protein [Hymenobacter caeli]